MLLLFELSHQLVESFSYVVQLLFEKPSQFLFDLLHHLGIVFHQALGVVYHLPEINHVLFNRIRYIRGVIREAQALTHFLNLHELVPIVIIVNALYAHLGRACLAKVLNHLVWMLWTRYTLKISKQKRYCLLRVDKVNDFLIFPALLGVSFNNRLIVIRALCKAFSV
jgi:hypothetical protein